jgi:hypothetical protein
MINPAAEYGTSPAVLSTVSNASEESNYYALNVDVSNFLIYAL